ncbi:MAG: Asp-tRNA(Asn)/Glu-tRNA(Gln) amidotransferase subunit GatA [Acidobacteria bacterium]|nr:MAG: Asp-tRNA(Asn)/Glu-tRNA(Gln) amidotransferase subunit GatA [Acidobacteriota bacterium]REK08592.1 MAG: Asp-tRNA(Asn)/Glu-tRNA(Gln) amidotransferase subunit GatA [Acidobacteriota bacterium]
MGEARGQGPELLDLTAQEIASRVRTGEVTAAETVDLALARIAELEPRVGALLRPGQLDDAARRSAEAIDARRERGESLGPLAGVPVVVKDNLSIEGQPLTCASRILDGYVAPYDATAIARLRAADAVIVGQSNMDEFAMGSSCENSAVQQTRNPWDPERVAGGSSGGSAAAVAAGEVPLALGSDTGGSVRQPAALCGVVGFKPSYGRISRYGLVAFASSLDQIGPIARSVPEAALLYESLAGSDPRDATCSERPVEGLGESAADDGGRAAPPTLEGLRIGRLREIDSSGLEDEVAAQWQSTLRQLSACGAELVDVSVPSLPAAVAVYYVIANSEASANLARYDGVRYGRRVAGGGSLRELNRRSRSEGFGPEVKRRIMLGTFALSSGYYDAYYGRAVGVARAMSEQFESAFSQVDLVVTPTSPSVAFRLGERVEDPLAMYLSDVFTTPANLCGLPALSVPCGLGGSSGLPLALQLLGPRWADREVLRAGAAFESASGWNRRVAPGAAAREESSSAS